MSPSINLDEALKAVLAFRDARDWKQFHTPKDLAAALAIEAAELQELFLWREKESADEVRGDDKRAAAVSAEIADIATYLLLMCHEMKIDLSAAIFAKLAVNEGRYSVAEHKGVAKKASNADEPTS